jgi:hypothetical protein
LNFALTLSQKRKAKEEKSAREKKNFEKCAHGAHSSKLSTHKTSLARAKEQKEKRK